MSRVRPRAAAIFIAVVFAGGVAAENTTRLFTHPIRPRGIAEECFDLQGGQTIGYAFESTAPVDFNIHFHRGKEVEYPVKRDQVQQADDRFEASSTQEFCLMWTNRTLERVTVKGRLAP
ncbi:MAG: hypothetical protein ABI569_03890 [Casimicrobiaceae bacterium]